MMSLKLISSILVSKFTQPVHCDPHPPTFSSLRAKQKGKPTRLGIAKWTVQGTDPPIFNSATANFEESLPPIWCTVSGCVSVLVQGFTLYLLPC
jgi:hypothetical protein